MNIVVIGIGLIGGSIALSIKTIYPQATIFGMDKNERHLQEALELGLIDLIAYGAEIESADLVIVAIPVDATAVLLPSLLDKISDHTLVCDMGSTKMNICEAVKSHPRRRNFVAMHPIAGTEYSGPKAAVAGLFEEKIMIICDAEQSGEKFYYRANELFRSLGMQVKEMKSEDHDRHIAYSSHLSHVASFMLGKTVLEKKANEINLIDMAGSGFESTVRLAKSSPDMWTPILLENRENVVEVLGEYIANLVEFKEMLKKVEGSGIFNSIEYVNKIGSVLERKKQNGLKTKFNPDYIR